LYSINKAHVHKVLSTVFIPLKREIADNVIQPVNSDFNLSMKRK